jgi:hypothetical protein
MSALRAIACLCFLLLGACAATGPQPPQIDRLPQGAAGPLAPPRTAPLSLDEVVSMARSETPSNVIIQTLRDTRASYAISAEEAQSLTRRGVPPDVVAYLRGMEPRPARRAVIDPYDYPYYPPYYRPYAAPYGWAYPYGPRYPGTGLYFGFGRRW